jgi:hypothetical protein
VCSIDLLRLMGDGVRRWLGICRCRLELVNVDVVIKADSLWAVVVKAGVPLDG